MNENALQECNEKKTVKLKNLPYEMFTIFLEQF